MKTDFKTMLVSGPALLITLFALLSCNTPVTSPKLSDKTEHSVYLLESIWANQHGEKMRLQNLQGKPQIIAMAYTNCEYSCPRIVGDMKRIEAAVREKNVGFVLVTFDPKNDTPKHLRTYAKKQHLDEKKWNLLHGNESDIRELAAVLGIQYKQTDEKNFAHSNVITLLNARGEIMFQQTGLEKNLAEIIQAVYEVLK